MGYASVMRIQIHQACALRQEPATSASVVLELPAEAKIRTEGFRTVGEESWLAIVTPTGERGFISGLTPFTQLSPTADELLVKQASIHALQGGRGSRISRRAVKNMMIGGGCLFIGLAVAIFTYIRAWIGYGDGTFYLLWGLAAFGAIRLTMGIFQYKRGE